MWRDILSDQLTSHLSRYSDRQSHPMADDLIPLFIPALSSLLLAAEDEKGHPLSRDDVLTIRDNASCIMVASADAEKMAETRGFNDIDPENCWYDWQMLRRELGRKPDLDPGAKSHQVRGSDPAYLATIQAARDSISEFRDLIPRFDPWSVMVKTELNDGNGHAFVWLCNVQSTETGFSAELFEVPDAIAAFQVGQSFDIPVSSLLDWMINDNGKLHGGFSLRYHRATLSPTEQVDFDNHIGVTHYL